MGCKIVLLGIPGSGKSTAARHIQKRIKALEYRSQHVNDYPILHKMFEEDRDHIYFRATPDNGFDAIDLSVLDIALQQVEVQVEEVLSNGDFVTIEFARDDYHQAFQQFDPEFLRDANIVFINADIETCLQRVHERTSRAQTEDDHPSFSDEIFRNHYTQNGDQYIAQILDQGYDVPKNVHIIENKYSLDHFISEVDNLLNTVLKKEKKNSKQQDTLGEPALAQ
jgi:shikimate kinase